MKINKGEIYRHFKGGYYYIVDLATDSETEEDIVIYHHLDEDDTRLWVRPSKMFFEEIDPQKLGNITHQNKRFIKINVKNERND